MGEKKARGNTIVVVLIYAITIVFLIIVFFSIYIFNNPHKLYSNLNNYENNNVGGKSLLGLEVYPPANISAVTISTSSINLSWSPIDCDILYFNRSTNSSFKFNVVGGSFSCSLNNFVDYGLNENTTYHYVFYAFENGSLSDASEIVHNTTFSSYNTGTEDLDFENNTISFCSGIPFKNNCNQFLNQSLCNSQFECKYVYRVGNCSGNPICSSFNQTNCGGRISQLCSWFGPAQQSNVPTADVVAPSGEGCFPNGHTCRSLINERSCTTSLGCIWQLSPGSCNGTITCGAQKSVNACERIAGCNWTNLNITKSEDSGLILINNNSSGIDFASNLASLRNWDIIIVNTSISNEIKKLIKLRFNTKKFHYLLIMGSDNEIPIAEKFNQFYIEYLTDPYLYGDLDDDGFLDISIGRIPFSDKNELEKYYSDLEPKGDGYYFENYFLNTDYYPYTTYDPLDEGAVKQYTYDECIGSAYEKVKVFRNLPENELVKHYYNATLLLNTAHGGAGDYSLDNSSFELGSLCGDYRQSERCLNNDSFYLSNRPILISLSCNNGKVLGQELIKKGASAFIGNYNAAGGQMGGISQSIIDGISVGDSFKMLYNSQIIKSERIRSPTISNTGGINIFDMRKLGKYYNSYGLILYGDPSIKLNKQNSNPNVKYIVNSSNILIFINKTKLFKMTENDSVLCYTGDHIDSPTYINSNYWGENTPFGASHYIDLIIPVIGVNNISYVQAIQDNKVTTLPNIEEGKIYYGDFRVNLVKGSNQGILFVSIRESFLNYSKDSTIVIGYN